MIKKMMGLVLASTAILSGCASTEQINNTEVTSLEENVQSFFNENRDVHNLKVKVYFVDKGDLILKDKTNLKELGSNIYKSEDFLNLIKDKKLDINTEYSFYIYADKDDESIIKSTRKDAYISSIEELTDKETGFVTKTVSLDNIEYGFTLISKYNRENEIFTFDLNLSDLIKMERHYATKDDYIEMPSIQNRNYKTELRVKEDSVFIQKYDEEYFVLSILKHDELKLQNVEQKEKAKANIKEPVVIVADENETKEINQEFNEIDLIEEDIDQAGLF